MTFGMIIFILGNLAAIIDFVLANVQNWTKEEAMVISCF